MQLSHFSHEKIDTLSSIYNRQRESDKPRGFWVSNEEDFGWKKFCLDKNFGISNLIHEHKIILAEDANILVLDSLEKFDAFSKEFLSEDLQSCFSDLTFYINWHKVAVKYHGIIIPKYFWERRHSKKSQWYYTWDCASGCIWDVRAIKEILLKD